MKKYIWNISHTGTTFLLFYILYLILVTSCNKQEKQQPELLGISVKNQLISSGISNGSAIITFIIPDTVDKSKLILNFTLSSGNIATINDQTIKSGDTIDFSQKVLLKINTPDHNRSTSYTILVQTILEYYGLQGKILSAKSLNKDYNYYIDQFDGSVFQSLNCGPAVTSMAIKWADSTFTKNSVDARNLIEPQGGWWSTNDIINYLSENQINNTIIPLNNIDSLVETSINQNNLVIFCLDMNMVNYNDTAYEHTQKFYLTSTTKWGHFLLVKGYIQTTSHVYFEIYDSYSNGITYNDPINMKLNGGELKGKDRYYLDYNIQQSANNYWPYAILVSSKGQPVQILTGNKTKSVPYKKIPVASGQ